MTAAIRALAVALAIGLLTPACITPATEVIVTVDTDVPPGLPFVLRVTAHGPDSAMSGGFERRRGIGMGAISLPASFAVVPARHGE